MLLLEQQVIENKDTVADGSGEIAHFYAVSAYILQHPDGMGYRVDILSNLRQEVSAHLKGQIRIEELRQKVRQGADGATRIIRREGDKVVSWPIKVWPMTVADILQGGVEGYLERVTAWAKSIIQTLDAAGA